MKATGDFVRLSCPVIHDSVVIVIQIDNQLHNNFPVCLLLCVMKVLGIHDQLQRFTHFSRYLVNAEEVEQSVYDLNSR